VAGPGSDPAPFHGSAALERLAEVVDQLAGVAIPASVLERDVLRARIPGYQPRLLDELGALGEVAWVGRGSLGRDDGRIALSRPGRDALRPIGPAEASDPPSGERHQRIREHLARRGASFYREIHAAAGGGSDREMLDALWDLVWAGEVTNDTFAPLRALRWKRPAGGSASAARRPGPGRLTSLGPPEAAGRWSLVDVADGRATSPTERAHAQALALLERHGVVTREAVAAEGLLGGFGAVYPVLRALEEAGRIRRGYFVDGLGAAQFAFAGALDRLRAVRDASDAPGERSIYVLAAADPANPFGAALPWPRRDDEDRRPFQRAAGAYVAIVDGVAALYVERGGSTLQVFPAADDPELATAALRSLATLVGSGRARELVIRKVDGLPVAESPWRAQLLAAGFASGYRGLVLRGQR
jgi:ATP-dependent Lhr-like helicase